MFLSLPGVVSLSSSKTKRHGDLFQLKRLLHFIRNDVNYKIQKLSIVNRKS